MKYNERARPVLALALLPLVLFYGCGTPSRATRPATYPTGYPVGYVERGVASWYGPGFHGRKTASGETYDMHQLTAAHRTLPLGSMVQVRSLTSGQVVTVRVNDRGPFAKGRILDLSMAGAQALGIVGNGTGQVEIRVVAYQGRPGAVGALWVQVASYADRANAQAMVNRLRASYSDVRLDTVEVSGERRYRVQVGRFASEEQAEAVANRLESQFQVDPLVVRDDT